MKNVLTTLAMIVLVQGCFTANPNKVQQIDTSIEKKGQVDNRVIGLNDKSEIMVQEETLADVELKKMEYETDNLNDQLAGLTKRLYMCRKDLADSRLGGSGELPAERDYDYQTTLEKYQEEVGLDASNDLKIVRKSYYLEKRASTKRLVEKLTSLKKSLKRQGEQCEWEIADAWRKAGLPGSWERSNSLDASFARRDYLKGH